MFRIKLLNNLKSFRSLSQSFQTDPNFDYNYLEKSTISTNQFQSLLPILPIPNLEDTCTRYLNALKPLVNEDQFSNSLKIVEKFKKNIGLQLNQRLLEINSSLVNGNYVTEDWFDMYLSSRVPLPINFNPFLILANDPKPEFNDPVIKASNYIISILRFRKSWQKNVLSPDVTYVKKNNKIATVYYDMSQYNNLLSSTRIPSLEKDYLQTYSFSKHIIIMKGGVFFKLNVLDQNENIKSPQFIYSSIKHIWNTPNLEPNQHSISILTTLPRNDWAVARSQLEKINNNKQKLELIDSAIFVLCLDSSETEESQNLNFHSKNFLHGCTKNESQPINRWFDKSFSLIVTQSGLSAINFEHSWGDGITLFRSFKRIYQDTISHHFVNSETEKDETVLKELEKLSFVLNPVLEAKIVKARKDYQESTKSVLFNVTKIDEMDRKFFKTKNLSPDSIFQLGFQLAYYKLFNGQTVASYEACSTSSFKYGRTETIRPATSLTKQACQMIYQRKKNYSVSQLKAILKDCSSLHLKLVKEASLGQGFDRHLFALKMLASKEDVKNVEFFEDEAYQIANHFQISTSSLFSDFLIGGGFSPVVSDGLGLAYGYIGDNLSLYCSNFSNLKNGSQYCEAFKESMNEIYSILKQ